MEWIPWQLALPVVGIALAAEFVDSTLGMGYGTALSPILLLIGFPVEHVVPAILFSEFLTGVLAAVAHQVAGNVDFAPTRQDVTAPTAGQSDMEVTSSSVGSGPPVAKVALILGATGFVGSVVAATIALRLPPAIVKGYIGFVVLGAGILVLVTRRRKPAFSVQRIIGLGLLAAFNKGISGGGFGPVVTSGQVTAGVNGKTAVAVTSAAEAVSCIAGLSIYVLARRSDWVPLGLLLVVGGVLSVPLSALAVRGLPSDRFPTVIGVATVVMGVLSLGRLIVLG